MIGSRLQRTIVQELKSAKHFAVLVDETSSSPFFLGTSTKEK